MNHNIPKYRKIWSDLSLFKFCPIESISSREFFSQHISISTGPSVSRPWCCYCTSAQKALKLLKPKKTARAGSSFGEWSPCADVSPAWDTLGSPGIPRADTQAFPQSLVSQAHVASWFLSPQAEPEGTAQAAASAHNSILPGIFLSQQITLKCPKIFSLLEGIGET